MRSSRVGDLLHLGLLVEDVEDAVAGGKSPLQGGAEVGKRHKGAERAERRHRGEHGTLGADITRGSKHERGNHLQAGEDHDGAGRQRLALARHATQAPLGKE